MKIHSLRKDKYFTLTYKLKRAMIFIALFNLYVVNLIFSSEQILDKVQNNCIWIKYISIENQTKIDSIIKFINDKNINKVFIETYNNGEILNKERIIFFENDSLNFTFNPLNYFIDEIDSLNNNTKIYAWMDVYKLWDRNYYPENPDHFYYQCPECLESDVNRKSDKLIKLNNIHSLEWEGIFLSPNHPKVNNHLLNVFKEILNQYNLDGFLLDYLRYQNYYYGYNNSGLEIFENKYGFSPIDLNRGLISKKLGYNNNNIDSLQTLWDNYRIDNVTNLLLMINEFINKESYNIDIIVSTKVSPYDAKNRWYQDWRYWLNQKLVDYVIVKNYDLDFHEFNYNNRILSKIYSNTSNLNKIIMGLNSYEDNLSDITNKILSVRLQKFNSISLYYYENYKAEINWYNQIYKTINFNLEND